MTKLLFEPTCYQSLEAKDTRTLCQILEPADHSFFELFVWFKGGKEAQCKPSMSEELVVQRLLESLKKSMPNFWTVILPLVEFGDRLYLRKQGHQVE